MTHTESLSRRRRPRNRFAAAARGLLLTLIAAPQASGLPEGDPTNVACIVADQLGYQLLPLNGAAELALFKLQEQHGVQWISPTAPNWTLAGASLYMIDVSSSPLDKPGIDQVSAFSQAIPDISVVDGDVEIEISSIVVFNSELGDTSLSEINLSGKVTIGTLQHEAAHIANFEYQFAKCEQEAQEFADNCFGSGCNPSTIHNVAVDCITEYYAWDACMSSDSDGNGVPINPASEAYANFAAFVCLCWTACNSSDPVEMAELMAAADAALQAAKDDWESAEVVSNLCQPPLSQVLPPMPPGSGGDPWSGPGGFQSCDCSNPPAPLEGEDPCAGNDD